MNATIRLLACAVVVVSAARAEPPATIRILVLDNENLLEGEVTRVEAGYQVRQPVGGDLTLPAARVLAVVADRRAAFEIVAARASRKDADERLRLANWCLTNRSAGGLAGPGRRRMRRVRTAERCAVAGVDAEGRPILGGRAAGARPREARGRGREAGGLQQRIVPTVRVEGELDPREHLRGCHAAPESKAFVDAGWRAVRVSQNLMAALHM